jgi:hypothetical protein
MFRARIGLAAAVLIAGLTAGVMGWMSATISTTTNHQVEAVVTRAQQAFPTLAMLRGIELTNETAKLAREDEFGAIFAKPSVDEQRNAAFEAVQVRNARFEAAGRRADLIAVVGPTGHVVSRDLNPNAMYDDDLKAKYPSVGKALDGIANQDSWNFDGRLYRVGAAPIRSRTGQLAGALVVGYVDSGNDAGTDRDKLGAEVAYFLDGKVQASSFKKQGGESAEEKALAAQLFGGPKYADAALKGELSTPFHIKLGGEEYVAATGPLPGNMTRSASGFVVLASLAAARAPYAGMTWWVLLLGLVALLAAVGAAVLTAMRFLMPLDAVERGVAEVINGNRDYQFEAPSPDFEGLANGLNVMIARLTGRPDPSDDELGAASRWQGELAVDDATGPQATPETLALGNEPEESYLKRVFDEYLAARRQTNEGTDGLTFEGFATKLRQNAEALKDKHQCRMVRFKVVVRNGQTTLKPVPIP